ncbi:MAG: sigma-70 family RNA polymerase sigma factor [Planctomycetota bacterium]|nr:sigma-70 family RNA polymerase sigma factor [Planctomycetota bacterium]
MTIEDSELIETCLAGDPDAFGRLVVRYQDRLINSLVKLVGSAHEAADVAQDAFVHAFQKLATFQGRSAFYTWLFRIAFNASVSRQRKRKRVNASIDAFRDDTGIEPTDWRRDSQPSFSMELNEQQQIVQEALSTLPEDFRVALVLKEMEGFKYEEIASIVGCPVGTVRSRIHRARQELREKLKVALRD